MHVTVVVGVSLSVDSLLVDCLDHGVGESFLDDRLVEDLMDNFLSVLDVSLLGVGLADDGNVSLLDEGGVLLVDDGLMMFMDVLLVHDRLVVLVDNVLMMLVDDISLVFNENVLVVLVDNILMDFLDDRSKGVRLGHSDFIDAEHLFAFI